jgi:thiol-disulfide isomerase/thioredoxin
MTNAVRVTTVVLLFASVLIGAQIPSDFGAYKAKEIRNSDVWINGSPVTLKALKGKVVLIDFWAFDCEPCIQTMPHIVDLYDKYGKEGLVVIGVHTPRADYEKDVSKLRQAITRMGIRFPVVVDEKQKIFRDYLCDLWPSQFIIDRQGIVRMSHGGVGRYVDMEELVVRLLKTQ